MYQAQCLSDRNAAGLLEKRLQGSRWTGTHSLPSSCAFLNRGGCRLKATFLGSVAARVAVDTEDQPAVNRWASAGAATSRCRSRFCSRSMSPRPRQEAGPVLCGCAFPVLLEPQWQASLFFQRLNFVRSCVAGSASAALNFSVPGVAEALVLWSGRSGRFWEVISEGSVAHSCSPFSDFVSTQPLNSCL